MSHFICFSRRCVSRMNAVSSLLGWVDLTNLASHPLDSNLREVKLLVKITVQEVGQSLPQVLVLNSGIPGIKRQRRQWHPTPVLLPGKSHGPRSLVGCSPWGHTESDMTEQLHFHFSLSYIGEENGNPLQCSCLENPRDGGAWWAAVYGVAQSRTWLKRLSSSSSSRHKKKVSFWLPPILCSEC